MTRRLLALACAAATALPAAASAWAVPARCASTQPSRLRWGAALTASAPAGTLRRTTVPPPVAAPSPISTGATKVLLEPVLACRPTTVRCLLTPS